MKAVVFEGEGKYSIKDVPEPKIEKSTDVLLEVLAASICGTDLHILEVPPGHPATPGVILGHEYVGKVVEVGSEVQNLKVGDHVVVDPNITCGFCDYCRLGLPNMCENMTTLGIFINGGFAKYNVAPAKQLYKISKDLPIEEAIFAEPLSCVLNATRKIALHPGESAVVLGAGPIGLYFTMLLKSAGGYPVIVSEPHPFRRSKALEVGADIVVNPKEEDLREKVLEATRLGADVVVDAVGVLLEDALKVVRRGGRVLLFGQNAQYVNKIRQNDITRNEITVMGSYIANRTFPMVVKVLEARLLPLTKLITDRIKISEFEKGLAKMREGSAIEVIVYPE